MTPRIAIGAIARTEQYYINDWVGYHLDLGFDHIYLYDNEEIEDESKYIGHFIDKKYSDKVTILDARGKKNLQVGTYQECFAKYRSQYDWMTFIDIDEFITITDPIKNIKDVLSNPEYQNWDAIRLNWVIYTDDNKIWGDLSVPVWDRFNTKCTKNDSESHNTKYIVNSKLDMNSGKWIAVHRIHGTELECHPNLEQVVPRKGYEEWAVEKIDTSIMYIRHYPTKTVTEFKLQKFFRPNVHDRKVKRTNTKNYMWWYCDYTKEKDYTIDYMPLSKIRETLEKTWTTRPKDTIL